MNDWKKLVIALVAACSVTLSGVGCGSGSGGDIRTQEISAQQKAFLEQVEATPPMERRKLVEANLSLAQSFQSLKDKSYSDRLKAALYPNDANNAASPTQ